MSPELECELLNIAYFIIAAITYVIYVFELTKIINKDNTAVIFLCMFAALLPAFLWPLAVLALVIKKTKEIEKEKHDKIEEAIREWEKYKKDGYI